MKPTKFPIWTYSKLSTFQSCPRQYQAQYVTKEVPYVESEQIKFGNELHKAAELYVKLNTPIPDNFTFIQPYLDRLLGIEGKRYIELKLAIAIHNGQFTSCDYWDKDCWWRGVVDLLIHNTYKDRAYLIDYKSGKNAHYADTKQLAILATAVFLNFPRVKIIKGMLLYLVSKEIVKEEYEFERRFEVLAKLNPDLKRMKVAHETGVFNPIQGPFCKKWCGVVSCIYNGSYSGE